MTKLIVAFRSFANARAKRTKSNLHLSDCESASLKNLNQVCDNLRLCPNDFFVGFEGQ